MFGVRVHIMHYTEGAYPGWVECHLSDAHGRRWSFVEKVPVVSEGELRPDGPFPQPGLIACEVLWRGSDASGREIAWIDTERPWGVASLEGATRFEVAARVLVEW